MDVQTYGVLRIDDQHYGIALSAIKSIEASDKVILADGVHVINFFATDYPVKNIVPDTQGNEFNLRELVLVLNSENQQAILVDNFQSMQLNEDHIHSLPAIMKHEASFIDSIYFDPISKNIIYLCNEQNFYQYLDDDRNDSDV